VSHWEGYEDEMGVVECKVCGLVRVVSEGKKGKCGECWVLKEMYGDWWKEVGKQMRYIRKSR